VLLSNECELVMHSRLLRVALALEAVHSGHIYDYHCSHETENEKWGNERDRFLELRPGMRRYIRAEKVNPGRIFEKTLRVEKVQCFMLILRRRRLVGIRVRRLILFLGRWSQLLSIDKENVPRNGEWPNEGTDEN
jgi:hypothetical protein